MQTLTIIYYYDRIACMHIYSISSVLLAILESGIVASFSCIKNMYLSCNLGYRLYLEHPRWLKKGGSSEPPLYTGLTYAYGCSQ